MSESTKPDDAPLTIERVNANIQAAIDASRSRQQRGLEPNFKCFTCGWIGRVDADAPKCIACSRTQCGETTEGEKR